MENVINYFHGDVMASDAWRDKYQMKNAQGIPQEETPTCMHKRLAREFAKVEYNYTPLEAKANLDQLSHFGKELIGKRISQTEEQIADEFFSYFDKFKYIVPQGSIMTNLGNPFVFGSLSNCFGIAPPSDSYSGIMRADQELVQLMKRRGGVGTHLNNLRPSGATVTNAAKTSSGTASFAERFSNSTREVGQEGRRGALMLLLHIEHPEIFKWITMKADRSKVTGANVSVMFTDDFMFQVEADAEDFVCKFPVDDHPVMECEYVQLKEFNKLYKIGEKYFMKVKPKQLFDEFVSMAWDNAEPGAAYIDRIVGYAPDGVYELYVPELCNPCGEQWFHRNDTCRLIAENFFGIVKNPFTPEAEIDFEALYKISYMQQRLGDNLVDLEAKYIDRIIDKLEREANLASISDRYESEPEIRLWKKIKTMAVSGRRTGNGFTGLGDMLAAINLGYDQDKSLKVIEQVMRVKMQAELDCTIDMAITRGTFTGWDSKLEFKSINGRKHILDSNLEEGNGKDYIFEGLNEFYDMLVKEFPEQAKRMYQHGRRNVSWSTVAPTGTVSLMTQTTSGLEPLFKAFYIRRKKINGNAEGVRVDFIDQSGDKWQEYAILHPKFKEWIEVYGYKYTEYETTPDIDNLSKEGVQLLFEKSPWYGSQAEDISWQKRIEIQAIIQKYTSNAISSTLNLPTDVSKETVYGIYMEAWKKGLKGVTIYRDGCRTGVLVSETKLTNCDEFGYTDAIKRPKELEADYHTVVSKGKKYAVLVGLLNNNPYELFAFEEPIESEDQLKGKIIKEGTGKYSFISSNSNYTITNLQLSSDHSDEKLLTRWVSLLLRHGANPKFIIDQVEKSEVQVVSFAKAITRVLKTYIPDETMQGELCPQCNQATIIREEGCKKCTNCGHSKC